MKSAGADQTLDRPVPFHLIEEPSDDVCSVRKIAIGENHDLTGSRKHPRSNGVSLSSVRAVGDHFRFGVLFSCEDLKTFVCRAVVYVDHLIILSKAPLHIGRDLVHRFYKDFLLVEKRNTKRNLHDTSLLLF